MGTAIICPVVSPPGPRTAPWGTTYGLVDTVCDVWFSHFSACDIPLAPVTICAGAGSQGFSPTWELGWACGGGGGAQGLVCLLGLTVGWSGCARTESKNHKKRNPLVFTFSTRKHHEASKLIQILIQVPVYHLSSELSNFKYLFLKTIMLKNRNSRKFKVYNECFFVYADL